MSTALTAPAPLWDAATIKSIKDTVCKGATESQFVMFMEVCRSTGLNPFLKEIYFVPSVGVMAARDGYLRVANQHPQFDGMETRVERDEKHIPIKAVCTVWRKDRAHPVICEAYYNEYKKGGNVWSTYPSAMIAKVAEVLALKRSFAINGVVTEEEIGEQGSKEAQREYLAEKGLEPWQKENRAPEVSLQRGMERNKQVPAEIHDFANIDPMVTHDPVQEESIKQYELRHATSVAEADAVLAEVAGEKPKKRKRGAISFDALRRWKGLKEDLRHLLGTDDLYYKTLKTCGFDHADEIDTEENAKRIWTVLLDECRRLKSNEELPPILAQSAEIIGQRAFSDLLGAHGVIGVAEVLLMTADARDALLAELKALVDARQASNV